MKKQLKIVRMVILIIGLTLFFAGAGMYYNAYSSGALESAVGDEGLVPLIFMLIGFTDTMTVLIWGFVLKKREQKEQWLLQNGQTAKAKFLSVDRNTNFEVNGKNPYILKVQWQDSITSQIHIFKSRNLWNDPAPFIDAERTITVYYDPSNLKSYVLDLSFLPEGIA